jgi:hypothetical protein
MLHFFVAAACVSMPIACLSTLPCRGGKKWADRLQFHFRILTVYGQYHQSSVNFALLERKHCAACRVATSPALTDGALWMGEWSHTWVQLYMHRVVAINEAPLP